MVFAFVSVVFVTLIVLYLYLTRNFRYWQIRGIPCPGGTIPGIGHMWRVFIVKNSFSDCCYQIYKKNKKHSMVGLYNFTSPALMPCEPELVKTVLQTNFMSFHMNTFEIDPSLDPLLSGNPFFNYGDKWVEGRKRLTYAFSNMRLKSLLESVKQVCKEFETYLDRKLNKTGKIEMELKFLFGKFTAQVVAASGFGVNGFSFDDDKECESFHFKCSAFLKPSLLNNFFLTVVLFMPSLNKIFRTPFLPKDLDSFFRTIINTVINQRKMDKITRNDFLQLMIEMHQTENKELDLNAITSSVASFFVDGYETSSTVLSFIGFELASHPKVQEKLREEVISTLNKCDGVITYEALKSMTYMDQVINETMRIYPALGVLTKKCTEEIELKGSDGLTCRVQPGTEIVIPMQGLHKDSRYWENPKEFDPERFNSDKKHIIDRFAFLPFGEGPRMCVGMRMAQLQLKACLATFLPKFSLELSPKTQLPLKMVPNLLNFPHGGIWTFIRPIN